MSGLPVADVEPVLDAPLFGPSADQRSIAILREFEPPEGYWFANSFGKDSTVVRDLLARSGVRYESHHGLTTIDAPELIRFGRKHHPETIIDKPRFSFWQHVACVEGSRGGLPTSQARWCCEEFKECWGVGRTVAIGVRAAESAKRAAQGMVQVCRKSGFEKRFVKPIFFWSTAEVWEYIRRRNLPYCELYDQGWHRIGCVMCPFSSAAEIARARERWPRMFEGLLRAVRRAWPTKASYQRIGTPEQVVEWWLSRDRYKDDGEEQEAMAFDQFGAEGLDETGSEVTP